MVPSHLTKIQILLEAYEKQRLIYLFRVSPVILCKSPIVQPADPGKSCLWIPATESDFDLVPGCCPWVWRRATQALGTCTKPGFWKPWPSLPRQRQWDTEPGLCPRTRTTHLLKTALVGEATGGLWTPAVGRTPRSYCLELPLSIWSKFISSNQATERLEFIKSTWKQREKDKI